MDSVEIRGGGVPDGSEQMNLIPLPAMQTECLGGGERREHDLRTAVDPRNQPSLAPAQPSIVQHDR
jgi:hypothetical protein